MVIEYIMIATRISDDGYVRWPSVGATDPTANFAPISSSLLNLPATVDYSVSSPTAGAGGIVFTVAGGDLSGNYPNPTVAKIDGVSVSIVSPADTQVLTYDATDGYLTLRTASGGSGAGSGTVRATSINTTTSSSDFTIAVDSSSSSITVQLDPSPASGKIIQVKDATGHAATHNIIIAGNGNLIDGVSSITISQNYGNLSVIYTGSQWSVI